MTLDAVLFDTPVLCLNFNLLPKNAWNAAHRHHQYPHFTHVINSGAVTQVDNMSELINGINHSIKDPGYKSSERGILRNILTPDLPTGLLISDSIRNTIEHFKK